MIEVAMYDNIDKHATKAASFLFTVFNTKLYVPPFTGIAVTTSEYTLRNIESIAVTSNNPTKVY